MAMAERQASDALMLEITRKFDAPREHVFQAFTEPAQLVKWWGPTGMNVVDHDIDVREGGAWRTTIRSKEGEDHTMSGAYREITPYDRLVFTWGWERDGVRGHETVVTIELSESGGRTTLSFLQQIFESEEMRNSHQSGWSESFDCLEAALRQ